MAFKGENLHYEEKKETNVEAHSDSRENAADLDIFNKRLAELKKDQNKEFRNRLSQWNEPTPENIQNIRHGGVDRMTDNHDPLKKHLSLAAEFLNQEEFEIDGQQRISYVVDFHENTLAKQYIGFGDMLSPEIDSIMVIDNNGWILSRKAIRRVNPANNRVGYFDEVTNSYIPAYNNYRAIALTTLSGQPQKTSKKLAFRRIMEQVALYNTPASKINIETEKESEQADYTPVKNLNNPQNQPAARTQKGRQQLLAEGFRPGKQLPKEIVTKAQEILRRGNTFGTVTYVEHEGKVYAFRDEVHRHAATDNVPDRLKQNHHGITVYEQPA